MDIKKYKYDKLELEIHKVTLKSANDLFPIIMAGMTQLSIGNVNFFSQLKPKDFELFQEKLCEVTYIVSDKKRNLSILDINDNISDFLPLLFIFLEFNFGFFSKAQKILEPILIKNSESEENK